MAKERVQKILAAAGYGSRRACEKYIQAGRVRVNGEVVILGAKADPARDKITLDNEPVVAEKTVYILLNKPRGVISSLDPQGERKTVRDLVPVAGRLYPVGRLDADSEGLILLTNDGELTNRLTHPRFGVAKTYVVRVAGRIAAEDLAALQKGMHLDGRRARAQTKVIRRGHQESLLEIRLHEGRNRQIRRMLARLGHKVLRVHRRAIGPITDRGVKIGKFRRLAAAEVDALRKAGGGLQ